MIGKETRVSMYGANIITSTRIIFAIAMVLVIPFSVPFWIFYILGGLSDFLDGFVARKWKQQSKAGAKFDSIADMVLGFISTAHLCHCTLF